MRGKNLSQEILKYKDVDRDEKMSNILQLTLYILLFKAFLLKIL